MSSTPTKTPAKSGEAIFTPRELELLGKAMQCNKEEVRIDYAKFAELGGFKNPNSAKASWHGIKKKFERASGNAIDGGGSNAAAADDGDANGYVEATPKKTPASKKRKATAADADGEEATPTKSAKKPRKSKAKSAAAVTASDEDEEMKDVKKESESDEGAEKEEAVKKEDDDDEA